MTQRTSPPMDPRLAGAIDEIRTFSNAATFYPSVIEVFSNVLRANIHGFGAVNLRTGATRGSLLGVDGGKWTEVYYRHCLSHPAFRAAMKLDPGWAMRTTDIIPHEVFQECDLYREFFIPLGVTYDIAANCYCTEEEHISLIAWRSPDDFTDEELALLKFFAREVGQAFELATRSTASRFDQIATRKALADYHLTPREREVLFWIAQGKTNCEIAVILSLSARTVHKHVEHILLKLGVETRTAAARMAMTAK
jgi:DNA-binding CsgD family transcriptional regulator